MYDKYRHIFRKYDIRGIFGKDLTPEIVTRIGLAISQYVDSKFSVGGDIRKSTGILKDSLINGLVYGNRDVLDIGIVPIGVAIYSTYHMGYAMAYITASHLPQEWNGIKLSRPNGDLLVGDDIVKIMQFFYNEHLISKESRKIGKITKKDIMDEYRDFILNNMKGGSLKIVVDCGNGATSLIAPQLLRDFGYTVYTINCDIDSRFPARGSEPQPEKIRILSEVVTTIKADFGVAFDGDGDRTLFVDEKGNILSAEQAAIVMLEGGIMGDVVANVECSTILEKYVKYKGNKIYRVPVGRTFMIREMQKHNAVLGVESSGHFVAYKNLNMDDGIVTLVYFAHALSSLNKPLSKIIPPTLPFKKIKIDVKNDRKKFIIMEKLKKEMMEKYDNISLVDGIRIDLDEGWILIRPSNTEPVIRLTIEAKDTKTLIKLENSFLQVVKKYL
ncbi:MAG: hypothetical protein J7K23_05690 [Thermoproteales archaeon]|nr:hypothetical protein [Thermoproteales archaeon]